MSDETDTPAGIAGLLARGVDGAGDRAVEGPQRALEHLVGGLRPSRLEAQLGLATELGTFKTRVQSGGRVTVPGAERDALGIEEGDIVQTIVVPVDDTRTQDHE